MSTSDPQGPATQPAVAFSARFLQESSFKQPLDEKITACPSLGAMRPEASTQAKEHASFSVFSDALNDFDRLSLLSRNENQASLFEQSAEDSNLPLKDVSVLMTSKLANKARKVDLPPN